MTNRDPAEFMRLSGVSERIIRLSEIARVSSILDTLVKKPRPETRPRSSRINTEMASEFKRARVLAGPRESIEDRKVVRDFSVSEEEELRADFAVKNGVIHATALWISGRQPCISAMSHCRPSS